MTAKDLKNALLQEAVQGKLVPQIASEGNARDLLEEIRKEKLSHGLDFANAKSGKRKSKKETVLAGSNPCDIKEEEIPFDIPDNWCWCRLGEICNEIKRGKSPKYADKSNFLAFAQKCNVKTGGIDLGLALYLDENSITRYSETDNLVQGDIVINSTGGGTMGRVGLYETQVPAGIKGVYPDSHVTVIRSIGNINQHYLYYVLKLNQPVLEKCGTGSTNQTELKPAVLAELIIPLPPLAEQKRIVAAIEKFMPLIEEYGKKETQLKAINEKIGTLTKKAILQEAVQGKLVPQIASEGNARDLLEEIRKERLSHGLDFANAKSGKRKSKKETALAGSNPCDITEEEIPFDIPENWCWCRWGDLSESIQYGYNAPAKETGRIKMVRISDIHENKVFWDSVPYCDISEDEIQTYILKKNDILFARTGGTVGKSFLVQDVPCEAIYAGYLIRTHYNSEKLVPQYLKFFMESNLYWEQLKEGTIATAQPNCNGKTLSKMLIPLPPLAEQKRIVEAIENLLPLCEALKI
mgnify:CR=1 FL=1